MAHHPEKRSVHPLQWPLDWQNLPFSKRFLFSVPYFGPQAKTFRDIVRQLKLRSADTLESWKEFSELQQRLARIISKSAAATLNWPNDYFIPEDPFAIVVWDAYGDLATSEVLAEVERNAGLKRRTSSAWEDLLSKNFGEVVRILSQEASKAGDVLKESEKDQA